jgi:hypothetical protein
MLQAFVRVKPVSLGKVYAVYVGLVVFILGLAFDFVAITFGRGGLTVFFNAMAENPGMQQEVFLNPWQILLLTCLLTLIVMVLGFFYGILLALIYNLSANITGGVVLETTTVGTMKPATMATEKVSAPVVTKPVPVKLPTKTSKSVARKSAPAKKRKS